MLIAFIIYIVFFISKTLIYMAKKAYITLLKLEKAFDTVSLGYSKNIDILILMFF